MFCIWYFNLISEVISKWRWTNAKVKSWKFCCACCHGEGWPYPVRWRLCSQPPAHTSSFPHHHSAPPITSFCWLEDEEGLKMKKPIYQLNTSYTNSDKWLADWLGFCYIFIFFAPSSVFKREIWDCKSWILVFAGWGGDAVLSAAGASRGFVLLCAAGAGQRRSTHRHAGRNTESRPRQRRGESPECSVRFKRLEGATVTVLYLVASPFRVLL